MQRLSTGLGAAPVPARADYRGPVSLLQLEVRGVWYWRGPAPHHFVTVPAEASGDIAEIAGEVTYGWGMIPVELRLGGSRWTTSLWPKDGQYIVPLKAAVRAAESIAEGDVVSVSVTVRVPR